MSSIPKPSKQSSPVLLPNLETNNSSRRRQSSFSKRKLFSSSIILLSSSCACSSFLCRSYSVLVRSSSHFFLVQHAVFLHAPSACVLVLAVQVLSAALFLFLSLCCRRRCNVFHGLNHHPKKMIGFLICPIKTNQVTTGVSCPRRSVLPGIRKCRKRIQVIQA